MFHQTFVVVVQVFLLSSYLGKGAKEGDEKIT